ncbi:MAG: peptide deformylase [Erysipelotrichaceae bacterium]
MLINNDTIVKDNESIIRNKSEMVSLPINKEDREILMDMLNYVRRSRDPEIAEAENLRPAVGISAVQIGVLKQLVAIVYDEYEDEVIELALVNPKIVSHSVQSSYLKTGEGCLSVIDEHVGYVPRHARVTIKAYDLLQDKEITIKAKGYFAIILQHEIDHLSGNLFYDHINSAEPWKKLKDAIEVE